MEEFHDSHSLPKYESLFFQKPNGGMMDIAQCMFMLQ